MLVSLLQNRPLFQAICPGSLWARDNRWLLSRVQRLAGPAGGTGAFCPGWRHQRGQKGGLLSGLVAPTGTKGPHSLLSRLEAPTGTKGPRSLLSRLEPPTGIPFYPDWWLQPGQNSLAPLSPFLFPRPSHSAHLFLLFLARERGVLAHFFTTFVKIFDSPSIHRR